MGRLETKLVVMICNRRIGLRFLGWALFGDRVFPGLG